MKLTILYYIYILYYTNVSTSNVQFLFGFSIGKISLFFVIIDVNISDVFETWRGKNCVAINSYKFSDFRGNKDTTKVFRYTNGKCTVTAKWTVNLKTVVSINGEHSHRP
jgi:hypothetical protein